MPTYDYVCDACEHKFEEMQSFTAEKLTTCPKCGAETLRRLFGTGAAILFKGGGFYETDYRSDSYKDAAKSETTAAKPAEGSGSATPSLAPATTTGGTKPSAPAKSDGPAK